MIGTPWYGDDEILERWWPTAVRLWQSSAGGALGTGR